EQKTREIGIEESVVFAGEQDSAKLYYDAADVYISTSLIEGLPVTLIEAQLCGLPVLASNVVGNNEIVIDGKNGYLFDLDNIDQFIEKAQKLLNAENRDALGYSGHKLARDKFSM